MCPALPLSSGSALWGQIQICVYCSHALNNSLSRTRLPVTSRPSRFPQNKSSKTFQNHQLWWSPSHKALFTSSTRRKERQSLEDLRSSNKAQSIPRCQVLRSNSENKKLKPPQMLQSTFWGHSCRCFRCQSSSPWILYWKLLYHFLWRSGSRSCSFPTISYLGLRPNKPSLLDSSSLLSGLHLRPGTILHLDRRVKKQKLVVKLSLRKTFRELAAVPPQLLSHMRAQECHLSHRYQFSCRPRTIWMT